MPPALLFDISGIDLDAVVADLDEIRKYNPQRGDFEQLTAVNWFDHSGHLVGYKDVKADEFWVAGHIPGRPLFPGVLMIEASAQMCSFYVKGVLKWDGFIGFGGVEDCKFRLPVVPGQRIYFIVKQTSTRHRRVTSKVQGMVAGQIVFEATITGTVM